MDTATAICQGITYSSRASAKTLVTNPCNAPKQVRIRWDNQCSGRMLPQRNSCCKLVCAANMEQSRRYITPWRVTPNKFRKTVLKIGSFSPSAYMVRLLLAATSCALVCEHVQRLPEQLPGGRKHILSDPWPPPSYPLVNTSPSRSKGPFFFQKK